MSQKVLLSIQQIVSTGQALRAGQVWDSNRPVLLSLLRQNGVQSVDLGIAADDVHDVYRRMRSGLEAADVLITSGGVSMGERDVLKPVMERDFGADIHFARVNVKPGKPVTFATCLVNGHKKYIFGLPGMSSPPYLSPPPIATGALVFTDSRIFVGNPVSAFVTFNLFVKPLLSCLSNRDRAVTDSEVDIKTYQRCQPVRLELASKEHRLDDRPELARAVVAYSAGAGMPTAGLTGDQRSSRLLSGRDANALVLLPQKSPSNETIRGGDIVTAFLIG
jgi:gephyrin